METHTTRDPKVKKQHRAQPDPTKHDGNKNAALPAGCGNSGNNCSSAEDEESEGAEGDDDDGDGVASNDGCKAPCNTNTGPDQKREIVTADATATNKRQRIPFAHAKTPMSSTRCHILDPGDEVNLAEPQREPPQGGSPVYVGEHGSKFPPPPSYLPNCQLVGVHAIAFGNCTMCTGYPGHGPQVVEGAHGGMPSLSAHDNEPQVRVQGMLHKLNDGSRELQGLQRLRTPWLGDPEGSAETKDTAAASLSNCGVTCCSGVGNGGSGSAAAADKDDRNGYDGIGANVDDDMRPSEVYQDEDESKGSDAFQQEPPYLIAFGNLDAVSECISAMDSEEVEAGTTEPQEDGPFNEGAI